MSDVHLLADWDICCQLYAVLWQSLAANQYIQCTNIDTFIEAPVLTLQCKRSKLIFFNQLLTSLSG